MGPKTHLHIYVGKIIFFKSENTVLYLDVLFLIKNAIASHGNRLEAILQEKEAE
jgi:hypothetical protein